MNGPASPHVLAQASTSEVEDFRFETALPKIVRAEHANTDWVSFQGECQDIEDNTFDLWTFKGEATWNDSVSLD